MAISKVGNHFAVIVISFLGSLSFIVSCDPKEDPIEPPVNTTVPVAGVSVSQGSVTLEVGGSTSLTATISPSNATQKTVTWSSSNQSVATVSNGTITAVSPGSATITATADGKTGSCSVTVLKKAVAVSSVTLDQREASLVEDGTVTLKATVNPSDADDQTIAWESSDNEVATVDQSGNVTALRTGTAVITAKAGEKTATCAITVVAKVIEVTDVTLDKTEFKLTEGETVQLTVTVKPDDASDKSLAWTTSDETVATVDGDGKVTAIAHGEATITVKTGTKTGTCYVTVLEPVPDGAVDLGISVYWAACNIGATAPEEYGDYYAWGEVDIKDDYSFSSYKWYDPGMTGFSKDMSKYNHDDHLTILEPEDDVAMKKLGGLWRIPTSSECRELREKCSWKDVTLNGIPGQEGTSLVNGNTIFFPYAGFKMNDGTYSVGTNFAIWTSNFRDDTINSNSAYFLTNVIGIYARERTVGFSIRAVCK